MQISYNRFQTETVALFYKLTMSAFRAATVLRRMTGLTATIALAGMSCQVNRFNQQQEHVHCFAQQPNRTPNVRKASNAGKKIQEDKEKDDAFGHSDLTDLCLVSGHGHTALAEEVAALIGVPVAATTYKSFSDGECFVQFDENIRGRDVFILQSCAQPVNDTVMELLLTVSCARRAGARRVIAVVPYFGYKHHRRAAQISTKHQSRFLSSAAVDFAKMLQEMGADRVIAVDLQRPGQGQEACFFDISVPLEVIISMDILVRYFVNNVPLQSVVVVTPNAECFKKARKFQLELEKGIGQSVKLAAFFPQDTGSGPVKNKDAVELLPRDVNIEGADVIIVDDMIDTAGTLANLSNKLGKAGARNVYVAASHGLFTSSSMNLIESSPILKKVVVTDSLPLKAGSSSKVVQVGIASMLANVIQAEYFRWEEQDLEGITHGQTVED